MDMEELKRLIRLLKDESLSEITLWKGDERITVRQSTARQSAGDEEVVRAEAPRAETYTQNAPLVGTFHRRPSPSDPPFVVEGSEVRQGDTLCIIEAMKVMNEIQAQRPGRLERILIEDGQVVEYGQPLFLFTPQ
jgi:acetyl-CoA carboxylase biotin carboxyl carrier protein